MSKKPPPGETHNRPTRYEIWLKGHLEKRWEKWFDGFSITLDENGNTQLNGQLADQAALHGVLKKVRDVGLSLFLVRCAESGKEEDNQS